MAFAPAKALAALNAAALNVHAPQVAREPVRPALSPRQLAPNASEANNFNAEAEILAEAAFDRDINVSGVLVAPPGARDQNLKLHFH